MKRTRRNSKAYTLIEVVVAVIVLALVTAVVIPAFGTIQQNARDAAVKGALGQMRAAILTYSAAEIQAGRATRGVAGVAGGWPSFAQMDDIKYTSSGTLPKVMPQGDVPENPYARMFISEPDRVMPDGSCVSLAWLWEEGAAYADVCFDDPSCSLDLIEGGGGGIPEPPPPENFGGWCYNENTGQIWANTAVNEEAGF